MVQPFWFLLDSDKQRNRQTEKQTDKPNLYGGTTHYTNNFWTHMLRNSKLWLKIKRNFHEIDSVKTKILPVKTHFTIKSKFKRKVFLHFFKSFKRNRKKLQKLCFLYLKKIVLISLALVIKTVSPINWCNYAWWQFFLNAFSFILGHIGQKKYYFRYGVRRLYQKKWSVSNQVISL